MDKTITIIEVEVTGYIEVDLTDADIKRIAEDYRGDYDCYIKDMDFCKSDIDDYNVEDYEYSKSDIEKALTKYKLDNDLEDDFGIPYRVSQQRFLESCQIEKSHLDGLDTAKDTYIDRETLKLVAGVTDYNNPKLELNCVYFDKDNIVATDTRRMIVMKNDTQLEDIYIPKAFCYRYIEDENAELYLRRYDVVLKSNNEYFYFSPATNWRFPDYERIVPKELTYKMLQDEYFKEAKVLTEEELEYSKNLSVIQDGENFLCLNSDYLMQEYKFENFYFNAYNLPVMFSNEDVKYIIMPVIISKDDDSEIWSKIKKAFK
jgi:hypothetical protein